MKSPEESSPVTYIKAERKCFEKYKSEIDNIFSEFSATPAIVYSEDLINSLTRLKDLIVYCISESEDIEAFQQHFEDLRKEKDGYKMQAKRLTEENKWLREELKLTQDKLQKRELDFIELEENNKSLNFLLELQNQNIESNMGIKSSKSTDSPNVNSSKTQVSSNMGISLTNSMISFNTIQDQGSTNGNASKGSHGIPYSLPVHEVPPRLKTLHQLVIQYASQGRYEIAIPLCKQTLQDLENSSGHYHPDVATMLNILALVYRDKGDFEEAVMSLNEALEIRRKTLGPDSPKVAATLNNLSVLYAKQGNHVEAEPLCREALKIRETILGSNHPDVAKQLNNLALLCHNQGKYDEVERFYKRALNIYLSSYPSNDANVIRTKNNLASSYIKQGKFREAELLLKEVLNEALERQWRDRERDPKSKPIWVIAEEREKMKSLSMSMDTLTNIDSLSKNCNDENNSNKCSENGTTEHPPYGFEIRHNTKEEKLVLLATLKLLSSLYSRENKHIASNIVDEWLLWAGRSLSKYPMDLKWLSYESSFVQSDLFDSSQKQKTFWYPTPSPTNSAIRRPSSNIPVPKKSPSPFLYLDGSQISRSNVNTKSNLIRLSEFTNQSSLYNKQNLPPHLAPYLYKTTDTNSKFESEKGNIYDNFDKN